MKFLYLIALCGMATFTSCKKEENTKPIDPHAQDINSFLPTTAGSYWLYNSTEGGPWRREATGIDTMKTGYQFKYFTYEDLSISDKNPEYFSKFDGNYYTLFTFDAGTEDNYLRAIVLKDSCSVGTTWQSTGSTTYGAIIINMEINSKIISSTDSYSCDTVNLSNLTKVEHKLRFKVSGTPTWTNGGTITMWFGKKVGLVKQINDISLAGLYTKNNTDSLYQYHIAP